MIKFNYLIEINFTDNFLVKNKGQN
jgi:hypothetical protein